MTDSININNRPGNRGITADSGAAANVRADRTDAGKKPASNSADKSGTVELSSTTLVEALKQQIEALPEVNEARVEAVKQALANGEYQPDAEVIASKYSEIEKLLP